jgi:hypothetical protein
MWRTSYGERTLRGAEARLFAEALLSLLDEAQSDQLYDYELGLRCFDSLSYGQKVCVLSTIGNGLFREDVPIVPLTAVLEGGVAAVFQHLRNCVTFEIETDAGTTWRQMIVAARREMDGEGIPEPTCADSEEWGYEIEELADRVLWDADYEFDDLFMDGPPEFTRALRREMRIAEEYFDAIAEDLTDEQARDRVAELRRVCEEAIRE